jgi:hypothetical protein
LRTNGFSQKKKKYILSALAQKPLKSCSLHKALKLFIKALFTNGMAGYLAKAKRIFLSKSKPPRLGH